VKVTSQQIADALLEAAAPFDRKAVTLQYRPFLLDADWKWFWVLLPEDRSKALSSGQEDSRAEAATAARLMARKLHVTISKIDVLKPTKT
jgi:hypothetical protein